MADKKISQLVDGGAPQATDEFVVDRAGTDNFKLDFASIKTAAEADAVLDGDPAGGVLSGTYPDPGFAVDMATQAELDAEATARASGDSTNATNLANHIADATDAHAGSAIGNTPAGGVAATTVQGAINELDTEKANVANAVMDGDAAGGALGGTYPNPSFAVDMATQAELDVVSTVANAAVPKALYDANTVLAANSDDTPAAVTMGASTILARLAAGNIKAASVAEILTLLGNPYVPGGTDVALADGGTGASLADPNADRIMFWDDSAGAVTWLAPGTNLTITGTTLDAAGGGSSMTTAVNQSGHGLAVGDVVKVSGASTYAKAQADSAANAEVAGIVSAVADANNFTLTTGGQITTLSGLTANTVYFLSPSTAGLLTATAPSAAGQVSKPVFIAYSTTAGYFFNWRGQVLGDPIVASDGWTAAGETWTYASADAPTFTFTVAADVTTKYQAGQRIKLTQTTAKYFIITAVSTFSGGNTTITVYGGTDYTLANAAITSPFWSMMKAPFGFPLDPAKWTVTATDSSLRTQATPTQNTWYNLGSFQISVPIGCWNVDYNVIAQIGDASSSGWEIVTTLSTANNTESDTGFSVTSYAANLAAHLRNHIRSKTLTVAAKTTYFLNTRTTSSGLDNMYNNNASIPAVIRAVCAYL